MRRHLGSWWLAAVLLALATTVSAAGQSADLQLSKSDAPDPVLPGGQITYDIVLFNAGPDTAEFITLDDDVPLGTTLVDWIVTDPTWTCSTSGSGGVISCSKDALEVGASSAFTFIVAVDSGVTPGTVITNTVNAGAATPDPNEPFSTATADTTVVAPPPTAEVSVTKVDDPDPVAPGGNLVYTITVTNSGQVDATAVSLFDALPPETTFVSLPEPAGWTCTLPAVGTNDAVICSAPSLGPGSVVFTLTVAVDSQVVSGTQIFNSATVSAANDVDKSNNNSTVSTTVLGSADLSVAKTSSSPDPVMAGDDITYEITVTNAGPDVAAVTLSDPLPANTTFVSLLEPAGWSCSTPAPGTNGTVACSNAGFGVASAAFTLTVNVDPTTPNGTVVTNTATASSNATDGNPNDNSAGVSRGVITPPAVSGTKTVSGTFTAGGAITYTVVITNSGGLAQGDNPGAEFTDVLPPSLTLVNATATSGNPTAAVATNTVTWDGGLAAGASVTITINATINAGTAPGTTISNQGTILYDGNGDGSNETTAVTDDPATPASGDPTSFQVAGPTPVLSGTKTVSGTFTPGGAIVYTVVITNTGGGAQGDNPGAEFTDVLPSSLTLVSASASSGTATATVGTNTVTWNGALAAGASVTITINATIDSDAAPGTTISNQGTIAYDADGDGTNETTAVTDDPATQPSGDPTSFQVAGGPPVLEIPTTDWRGLLVLAALCVALGAWRLRRANA